jgi:hypothetical protein
MKVKLHSKSVTNGDYNLAGTCFQNSLSFELARKGKTDAALTHLQWVKEHADQTTVEFALSVAELDRLQHPPGQAKP